MKTNNRRLPEPDKSQQSKKRVAVVDDHTMMRDGLIQLINAEPRMEVCWAAASAAEAMDGLQKNLPDMMTVDITLPGRNGLELLKDILAIAPGLPILVVSMHDEAMYAQRVLKSGAKGYIMKDASHTDLMEAIRRVADGRMWLSDAMSDDVMTAFSGGQPRRPVDSTHKLSDREFEVFQHLGDGKSTQQIADLLNISSKTVDVHKSHIREKLNLGDSTAVLRHSIRWTESRRLGGS
ncbi:MAG: two component transcriptional regulator, LuxR family [Verrucomicrobiales bacterium]|nr:two component transcriptional regulator, LuxR family [Verrucomicrobiales bacterium]